MNAPARCEPRPGTAPWTHHWIGPADGDSEPWLWSDNGAWFRGAQFYTPEEMAARGWAYSAPVTPPAVVAALVEALEGAGKFIADYEGMVGLHSSVGVSVRAALARINGEAGQ